MTQDLLFNLLEFEAAATPSLEFYTKVMVVQDEVIVRVVFPTKNYRWTGSEPIIAGDLAGAMAGIQSKIMHEAIAYAMMLPDHGLQGPGNVPLDDEEEE